MLDGCCLSFGGFCLNVHLIHDAPVAKVGFGYRSFGDLRPDTPVAEMGRPRCMPPIVIYVLVST